MRRCKVIATPGNCKTSYFAFCYIFVAALVEMVNGNVRSGNVLLNVVPGEILIIKRLMGSILITRGSVIMFFRKVLSVLKIRSA